MRIVYYGNNNRGKRILSVLSQSKHEIIHAFGQQAESGWYDSIESTANENHIPYLEVLFPNEQKHRNLIKDLNPDIGIMCGYSKYMGKGIREIPRKGIINLHASKLPYYRGAAPLNWALINGETEIGLSIYFIDKGIDTGPIVAQEIINVDINTTIADLMPVTLDLYSKMIIEVCDYIENDTCRTVIQNVNNGSYYTKRHTKDGLINWHTSTDIEIHNLVRALTTPYPGAYFYHEEKMIKVIKTILEKKNYYGMPGRIATRTSEGIVVIARNRGIKILEIELETGDTIDSREYFKKVGIDL